MYSFLCFTTNSPRTLSGETTFPSGFSSVISSFESISLFIKYAVLPSRIIGPTVISQPSQFFNSSVASGYSIDSMRPSASTWNINVVSVSDHGVVYKSTPSKVKISDFSFISLAGFLNAARRSNIRRAVSSASPPT